MKSMTLNPTRLLAALAASLSLAAPLFAQTMPGTNPVKIFIVAGESNTSGKGTISPSTTPGTLDQVYANDETGRYQFLKSGGSYTGRNDVWIRNYVTIAGNAPPTPSVGDLTTGLGSTSALIGPEFGFGHVVGDVYENQVLIVKVGVDAATLAYSFCPPSSRVGEPEPALPADKGFYYKEIIRLVNEAKNNLGNYFPGYNGGGYEIAGLGWHQGWNDRSVPAYIPLYEVNMANFINDIRSADKGLGVTNMPVVIASAAMDWNYHYSEVELAQLKMTDATAYPAFAGNVGVVDCRQPYDGLQFWHPSFESPANEGFHWNRSGKSFLHVGMAMGDVMSQLVATRIPYRIRANGGSGGVTLTWNNGTETPTTVRVLRNGVEIAAAAPANPSSFTDATAPLGVSNYELQFTIPVTLCPPLAIRHHSGITNLKGNQRINGIRLTWDNNLGYTGITVKRNGSIIAASLPGTSYTDFSPPVGAVTYSVEPVDAGGTPVEAQVAVSAAPAGGALIYEPFDMTAGTTLVGKVGGIGLDGKWDGGTAIEVTSSGLYTFGTLPVFGNRIVRTTSNGSCTINIGNTLQEAGLMEHGAQFWFSFLCQNPNNSNIHPTLALGDDILTFHNTVAMGGNAIGAKLLSGNKVTGFVVNGGTQTGATATQATLAASEVVLVVGRITWGADASAPDTIDIYTPGTNLVLDTPQSVSRVVDQSNFRVLSMWGNGVAPNMDEIRFGDSYLDVIGQGTDTSGDLTPPTPATMSFVTPPAASSTTAITMTATTAMDANGVQYFFDETSGNPGGSASGWQDSPVYTDTGLNPDTEYTYTVQARDKSVNNNPNTVSDPASATTFPPDTNPPPTPGFSVAPNATSSSVITMTATTVTDPEGGSVEYFFDETSGNPGGTDSGWQSSPTYTDSGLNPNTQYTYTVKARDNSSPPNESAASAPASATTPASTVNGTQFWDGGGVDANWNTPENWGGDGLPAFTTTAINFGSLSSVAGTAFGGVVIPSQTTANNNLTAGTLIVGINFGNNGQANRTDAYTLQGSSIAFGAATNQTIGTTALHAAAIVSSIEDVVSLNIDLGSPVGAQNRQFRADVNHHLKFDGVISGGANAVVLVRVTDSKVTFTNANNSYLGATNISEGTGSTLESVLEITCIANGGSNSSIGASSNAATNLRFNNGFNDPSMTTLRYIGAADASTDRLFTLYENTPITNSRIDSSGAGTLSFTNTGAIATSHQKARNFYLGGTNTGENTFAPSLNDFTEVSTFTKQGVGKWIITGTHTYTGATTIEGGKLTLGVTDCLANTSNVVIGAGTLDVGAGFTDTVGTLDCTGAATINLGSGAALAFAASNSVNSGTWSGTLNITGTFGATSIRFGTNNSALTAGQLAKITVHSSGTYTLDSNGYLVAASVASAYNTWAASKGLTGLPGSSTDPAKDADPDKDGRNNLGEFAFNGAPLSGTDNGKVFVLAEDSDFDGDAAKELLLTVAVRSGTPVFAGSPLSATHVSDGITYSIEGSLDLAGFPTAVNVVPTPLAIGLPAAGDSYEYRSFSLGGSNGLTGKGFLRAKVTSP
jgi:autotransporter-associated beta strand protein